MKYCIYDKEVDLIRVDIELNENIDNDNLIDYMICEGLIKNDSVKCSGSLAYGEVIISDLNDIRLYLVINSK